MKISKTSIWTLENKVNSPRINFYLCDHKLKTIKDLRLWGTVNCSLINKSAQLIFFNLRLRCRTYHNSLDS